MRIYLHAERNGLTPISCETEVVPKEGEPIEVKHHKYNGRYTVERVEPTYRAVQENEVGNLKLEAEIHVFLLKHE